MSLGGGSGEPLFRTAFGSASETRVESDSTYDTRERGNVKTVEVQL